LGHLGLLDAPKAGQAVAALVRAPVRRVPTLALTGQAWQARQNVSAYDACLASARRLASPLRPSTGDWQGPRTAWPSSAHRFRVEPLSP
jgi:hypothetical protein